MKSFSRGCFTVAMLALVTWARSASAAPVELELRVIHAHNNNKTVDSKLDDLKKHLAKLSFTGYALKDEAIFSLELATAGRMQLPNKEWMVIRPETMDADGKLRLELSVEKLKFKTTVTIAPGGTLVVGGPSFENGALILAVRRPKAT